ncbi:MAG TPA: SLBB domain-containing protein, partial [Candidatus Brocadiaceae bacterium]
FSIPFCIFIVIVWASYPLLAQEGGSEGSSGPQAPLPNPFQTGFTSTQGSQPSNPFQTPLSQQGITNTQGLGASQTSPNLQNLTQQQNNQNTPSTQTSTAPVPQPQETVLPQPPSPIETAFQELIEYLYFMDKSIIHMPDETGVPLEYLHKLGVPLGGLRQFGYSLFIRNISTFAPVEDVPVGPDYVLGPEDELQINIWGAIENAYGAKVDRNGKIYLPTVGPVRVWGLTFSQAEKLIKANLSQYYKGFQTSVTMGHLRTIKVYAVGEVIQPGSFTISSLSTLTNALFAAGGPGRMGSLRKIELKRNHHTEVVFDFYDFLLHGDKEHDARLQSGDVIFVPPIGPVVGIVGQIKRPAIYELKGPVSIDGLIDMAGGLTPQSYLKHVQIIRVKPNAEREVLDFDLTKAEGKKNILKDLEQHNGDLVIIYPNDPRIYNTISLEGAVKYPGDYEAKPGMRLSHLLSPETLLPDAYLDNVEVIRYKADLTTDVIQVNLKKLWSGDKTQDVFLQPRDQIAVKSAFKDRETVTLRGEFKRTGTYSIEIGERISSVIKRAGGFSDKAYPKGAVFTRKTVQAREKEMLDKFIKQQEENLLSEEKTLVSTSPESQQIEQRKMTETHKQLQLIASQVVLGRIVIYLDNLEKFEGTQDDLPLQDGDTLTVPRVPAEVMILGSVRNPTAVIHKKGENIEYYINRGGGFSKVADKKEMYLLKADGSAIVGFLKLRNVDPGDAIIIPPKTRIRDWTFLSQIATIAGQTALTMGALSAITK